MTKDKSFWIKISVAGVLIVAIIVTAVVMIVSLKKEDRYKEHMRIAEAAYEDMDYEKMIEAYEAAIELMPEDPDAYLALAEYYMEVGEYEEAESVAKKGYRKSGSGRLNNMLGDIEAKIYYPMVYNGAEMDWLEEEDQLVLRNNTFAELSEFCFQQYVDAYGDADVKYMSAEEGCRVKFKGLNAYAYFKNTTDNKKALDSTSKKPVKNAKPYKIVVMNPQLLFVGLEGAVKNDVLEELFKVPGKVTTVDGKYYYSVEYMDCIVLVPTDEAGNLVNANAQIELQPMNLVSDWEEVVVEEEEEEVPTFRLGGQDYTYDITSLYIYGETLHDLTPLKDCEYLEDIVFVNCYIEGMDPLKDCDALVSLDLRFSSGDMDLGCLAGLSNLKYLGFHECTDINDLSPIMNLELYVLHPCGSSVSIEQCIEYQERHPNCEVWFDYEYPIH